MSTDDASKSSSSAAAAAAAPATVTDATCIFWLQNQQVNPSDPLLTEAECPLPSVAAVFGTMAPFLELARRDTEHLASSGGGGGIAPEVVRHRDALCAAKHSIDGIQGEVYQRIRDRLFPLARSGPMSQEVGNRAAYKLLESMESSGITQQLFPSVPREEGAMSWRRKKNEKRAAAKAAANAAPGAGKATDSTLVLGAAAASDASARQTKDNTARNSKIKASELVFVDVCGGPGSFAQALLCHIRKPPKMKVRGYGMTLHSPEVDAQLAWYPTLVRRRDFTPTFGLDGSGSVYLPANVEALCSLCAGEKQLLLVMGDGGFEVDPDKITMQESITGRLVFSQWYIALRLLRQGGALVLKLFETSSVFLRSMLTLSCLFFTHVAVVKPAHSRVVNSERYLSCRGFRVGAFHGGWLEFLRGVHATCFSNEAAPFTLLPNIVLDTKRFSSATAAAAASNSDDDSAAQRRHPLFSILTSLEESIITTAARQTTALMMIENEFNKRRKEAAAAAEETGRRGDDQAVRGGADDEEGTEARNGGGDDEDEDGAVSDVVVGYYENAQED